MRRIYFDHSATTPVDPRVARVVNEHMLYNFGNPSSIHLFGREAKTSLEKARTRVASLLNCDPEEIYFTSGGTESDNLALIGYSLANRSKGNHIVIGGIEHPAVRNSAIELEKRGFEITSVKPDRYGEILSRKVFEALKDNTMLVSVMHVNNEVGTINDIASIGSLCRERGIAFHTDAVQSYGKVHVDVQTMSIDLSLIHI